MLQSAILLAAPADAPPDDPAGAYGRGMADSRDGKFQDAIKEFDQAIRLDPGSADAFYARGIAYEGLNQPARAFPDFDQAVALKPDFQEAISHRGRASARIARSAEAIKDLDRALALKPDDAKALESRGVAYVQLGQARRAMEDFGQAIKLAPDDAEAFESEAMGRHALGDDDRALDDYTQAIKLKPDYAWAFNDRGTVYEVTGRYDRAIQDFDQAISIQPDLAFAFANRGDCRYYLGHYPEAIADLTQAIALQSNFPNAYVSRANAYRKLRQYPLALADYNRAIDLLPGFALALENRAQLYAELRDTDRAVADWGRAADAYAAMLRRKPNDPPTVLKRAFAASSAYRLPDAIAGYSDYIARKDSATPPLSDSQLAYAYLQRGWVHSAVGDKVAALTDIETALRLKPNINLGKRKHASVLRALGRYEDALSEYDDIISPNDDLVYYERAVTYFCLGRYGEAEEDFKRYLLFVPSETTIYDWIHIIHVKRGLADDKYYTARMSPYPDASWMTQIANLYRGRQTIAQTVTAMTAPATGPWPKEEWPCSVKFFLGEYRLEHGDLAGAKTDLGSITPASCDYAAAAAAVAEVKRLPAN